MIIISAQPNWHFFFFFSLSVGAQMKKKKTEMQRRKKENLFSSNRIDDKQPIVFHLIMMIR
jgi:hypothetical protein